LTCGRSDVLAAGSSYPAITLTVDVAADAPASVTNTAAVSGGGDSEPDNNTVADPTTVTAPSFADVAATHPFLTGIEALLATGITGGCGASPPRYCPDGPLTRGQMAVFLLRAIHGAEYQPPDPTGTLFADVPIGHAFARWIEQLAREGITGGCATSPARYCPDAPVTRAEMAVFLVRTFELPL
jgi:hypothetical protein